MSRSGYSEDTDDQWGFIRWRGQVASSIKGKRGQALLKDLAKALDDMPEKKLIARELEQDGSYCALGVVGAKRGLAMKDIDPEEYDVVANAFGIAEPLAREIVYYNDDVYGHLSPEQRWTKMREWVQEQIRDEVKP